MRTRAGVSPLVSTGNAWFTLLGFLGLYTILGILFLFLVYREIEHGPEPARFAATHTAAGFSAD
jgi:cytochrome d ubiquinol oxidase subunit I